MIYPNQKNTIVITGNNIGQISTELYDYFIDKEPTAKRANFNYKRPKKDIDPGKSGILNIIEEFNEDKNLTPDVIQEMIIKNKQEGFYFNDIPRSSELESSIIPIQYPLNIKLINNNDKEAKGFYKVGKISNGTDLWGGFHYNRAIMKRKFLKTLLGKFLRKTLPKKVKTGLEKIAENCQERITTIEKEPLYIIVKYKTDEDLLIAQ